MLIPYADCYRILAIDPSTTALGVAVLDVNLHTGDLYLPVAGTWFRKDLVRGIPWLVEQYGERAAAVKFAGDLFRESLDYHRPHVIQLEEPYIDPKRSPDAYRGLVEITTTFKNIMMDWDCQVPLYTARPSEIKKAVGTPGNSGDKELVRGAVLRMEIPHAPGIDMERLGYDATDAIAIAYYRARQECTMLSA